MHEKLLHRAGSRLVHRHHDEPPAAARTGPDGFGLDQAAVGRFTAGTLGPQDEAGLAQEVAELLPHGWDLPNKPEESLRKIVTHLGGQEQLLEWLDGYQGLPQLTARIYALLGLLDQYGDEPAVVMALRESRGQQPYPAGLRDFLVPQTNEETLSDLGYRVEEFLSEGKDDNATALALATADWLRQSLSLPGAPRTDPGDLAELVGHARTDIDEAAAAANGEPGESPRS